MESVPASLLLVDLYDQVVGTDTKENVHRAPRLHRAFSVFLVHDGKMLLQQRAADKYHSGGLWSNSCCSHPRLGESLEEAVGKRLQEELGIACPTTELFEFTYCNRFDDTLFEYEYDHVFLGEYDGPVTINPEEAQAVRWVPFDELEQELMQHPMNFSVWFLIAAPKVLAILRGKNNRP